MPPAPSSRISANRAGNVGGRSPSLRSGTLATVSFTWWHHRLMPSRAAPGSHAFADRPERMDLLGDDGARLGGLGGAALDERPDDTLQAIVDRVAAGVGAPIALVSLVLRRVQLFRAHTGLGAALVELPATD